MVHQLALKVLLYCWRKLPENTCRLPSGMLHFR